MDTKNGFAMGLFLLTLGLTSHSVQAQTPEEFERYKREMQEQFERDKEENRAKFRRFKAESDSIFAAYLRESWQAVALSEGRQPENTKPPKLPVPPQINDLPQQRKPNPIRIKEQPLPAPDEPSIADLEPPVPKPEDRASSYTDGSLAFMGKRVLIRYDQLLPMIPLPTVSEPAIGDFWEELSRSDFQTLQAVLIMQRNQMQFNDWGYYLMAKQAAEAVYPDANRQTLLTWFLLCQAGFRAKVGFRDEQIYLLLPFKQDVYQQPFYRVNNMRYYLMGSNGQDLRLLIHRKDYPGATNRLSLDLPGSMPLAANEQSRTLTFEALGRTYTVNIRYDQEMVRFYETYPWTQFDVYFHADVSATAKVSLSNSLKPVLKGHDEQAQVAIILAFVQKAFQYQTDDEQFGYEKPFFVEEVFHYPYSDCEDRSVLFAYLVRELVGLRVVGLLWPGHLATAVRFEQPVDGDYFTHQGERYTVCDPTYINAPIGLTMPKYQGEQAEIIVLRN